MIDPLILAAAVGVTLGEITPATLGRAAMLLVGLVIICSSIAVCQHLVAARSQHPSTGGDAGALPCSAWPRRRSYLVAGVSLTAIAVCGSLVPLVYQPVELQVALERFQAMPYQPLGAGTRADWAANILLFIPFGYFWLGTLLVDRQRLGRTLRAVPFVILFSTGLSTALEFAQIWFPHRSVSQNDILAETIGGTVGVVLWLICGQLTTDWIRSYTRDSRPKNRMDWLLEAYCVAVGVLSILPLDLTVSATELVQKYREGRIALVPFSRLNWDLLTLWTVFREVAVFVPVGMLVSTWLTSRHRPVRSLSASLLLGGLVALAVELAQVIVYPRFATIDDVILGTIGAGIGARVMQHWRGASMTPLQPAGPGPWRWMWLWLGLAVAYTAILVVVLCAPFEPIHDHRQIRARYEQFWCVPFARFDCAPGSRGVSEVLQKTVAFAPLGAMFALATSRFLLSRSIRRILLVLLLAVGAGIATGIEMLQIFLPSQVADTSDVILATLGAAAGMCVAVRILDASNSHRPC